MNEAVYIRPGEGPRCRSQWRRMGRGIKDGALPDRMVSTRDRDVALYRLDQTTKHSPYVVARNYLVDLFVGYPDRFGYTAWRSSDIRSVDAEKLIGPVSSVIERGFNYAACKNGIRFGCHLAESFHITAPDQTDWFVIDFDNHDPTLESTQAHLELLQQVQANLPRLLQAVGAKSSFFQYRQIEPTGIQLWVLTWHKQDRQRLHNAAREFLQSLGNALDQKLCQAGLPGLSDIEIKPTSTFISMVGCYGKEVFTTERLRIVDKRFDCIGLYNHIAKGMQAGNVLPRYSELAYVRELESREGRSLLAAPPATADILIGSHSLSWADRKHMAVYGVQVPDVLHDRYLEPLAQVLLLREFYGTPNRDLRAFTALRDWVLLKHNGLVSRINQGRISLVEDQIRSTIRGVNKNTGPGILAHYEKMRSNDKRYPARVESLAALMAVKPNTGPLLLIDCKAGVSCERQEKNAHEKKSLPALLKLPKTVSSRLRAYLRACVRRGKIVDRLNKFTHLLISEIGPSGSREINESRLHQLAGKDQDSDPTYLRTWKKHLVAAGILKRGWHRNIVRGVRSSRYELTDWVVESLRGDTSNAAGASRNAVEAQNNSDRVFGPKK